MMKILLVLLIALWPVRVYAQLGGNIPDVTANCPNQIQSGQVVTVNSALTIECYGVKAGGHLDVRSRLDVGTLLVYPGGKLTASVDGAQIRILPVVTPSTDPEQWGTGLLCFGTCELRGPVMSSWLRLTHELAQGQTSITFNGPCVGCRVGDEIAIMDTREAPETAFHGPANTPMPERFTLASGSGTTWTLNRAASFDHPGTRNADGTLSGKFAPVAILTRRVKVESADPSTFRGHVVFSGSAQIDVENVEFRNLGRTTLAPITTTHPRGKYAAHFHMLESGARVNFQHNAIVGFTKWGLTIHSSHGGLYADTAIVDGLGAAIMTEVGNESNNDIVGNLAMGVRGTSHRADVSCSADGALGCDDIVFLRGGRNRVRNNVIGNGRRCLTIFGDSGGVGYDSLLEVSGNEVVGCWDGVELWYVSGGSVTDQWCWHTTEACYYAYPTENIVLDRWNIRGDPRLPKPVNYLHMGMWGGDYCSTGFVVRNANIQNMRTGLWPPYGTSGKPRPWCTRAQTTELTDSMFDGNVNDIRIHRFNLAYPDLDPSFSFVARRNQHGSRSQTHLLRTGPVLQMQPGATFTADVDDHNRTAGDDFALYSNETAPPEATTREKVLEKIIGGTAPQTGVPTTSAITILSGPTTIQNGQRVWKMQSVEGPLWTPAIWGTNTHRFNVTVVPGGTGALPVFLELHSATGNGPMEPAEFIDTLTPGIYVSPVDISYQHGLIDPVTGQGRFFSRWMGYSDSANVYQPVTAERVVRYVQWTLAQTQLWTADSNRVYVRGGSMGGGGAMHVAMLFPTVFAAAVSTVGWVDLQSWAPTNDMCKAGMRWQSAVGPLCTDMLDMVHLVQRNQTPKPPLFLTWNSNDTTVLATRYPSLLASLDAGMHPYQAEWRVNTVNNHQGFPLPGDPHLGVRKNSPTSVTSPTGTTPTATSGTRTNIGPPLQSANIQITQTLRYLWHSARGTILGSVQDYSGITPTQWDEVNRVAVDDLGYVGLRVDLYAGIEGDGKSYTIVNDNADPNVINPAGFNFAATLDVSLDIVHRFRQKVVATGQKPYIHLTYVNFSGSTTDLHVTKPDEYAEYWLAIFQHVQARHGWVPDGIEVALEPDTTAGWTPTVLAKAMLAAKARLNAAGFTPDFLFPASAHIAGTPRYIDEIAAVPGALDAIAEFTYHRYGGTGTDLDNIGIRAQKYSKRAGMNEYWGDFMTPNSGASWREFASDYVRARNNTWTKGVLADAYGCVNQIVYFPAGAPIQACTGAWMVRPMTKYIRPGAQCYEVTNTSGHEAAIACRNPDGRFVAYVIGTQTMGPFSISGLPAGTYEHFFLHGGNASTTMYDDITLTAGQIFNGSLPMNGVYAIIGKGTTPPPPLDSDGDGVIDANDKCPGTPAGAVVDTAGCPVTGFPINMEGTVPEEATVSINVTKPTGVTDATVSIVAYDPDYADEGELYINGNGPIVLFGAQGIPGVHDSQTVTVTYPTPAAWWNNGANSLRFRHTQTLGFRINGVTVTFSGTTPEPDADGDKEPDSTDKCPGTPAGATVDADGCALSQKDSDNDTVTDDKDKCPGTSPGVKVDADGCALPPTDPCVVDPLNVTRISWPATNAGRRSLTFDVGTKRWVTWTFWWDDPDKNGMFGVLEVTDSRGCKTKVMR